MWVGQFGLSILFPFCLFLYLGFWLQTKFNLGWWIMLLCGVVGFMTSISTAKSCLLSFKDLEDVRAVFKQKLLEINHHRITYPTVE